MRQRNRTLLPASLGERPRAVSCDAPAAFRRDQPVVVTAGLNEGLAGVVRSRAELVFGNAPMWNVDLGGILGVRTIREDFLAARNT